MDVMFTHCPRLDVHNKTVMVCRATPDPTGQQPDGLLELEAFGTVTADLLALSDWLAAAGITHVAMESSGAHWKSLYNILEGDFTMFLVNAAHVKQLPGRKTDKADVRWPTNSCAMLARDEPYRELGSNDSGAYRRAHLVDQLMRRIERLGYHVTLEPVLAA